MLCYMISITSLRRSEISSTNILTLKIFNYSITIFCGLTCCITLCIARHASTQFIAIIITPLNKFPTI